MTNRKRGGVIYGVFDSKEPDRIRYVGLTRVSLEDRIQGHWYDARRAPKRKNSRMVNWLLKRNDRPSSVVFAELGVFDTWEDLSSAEVDAIAYFRSLGMADLNIAPGGEGGPGPCSESTRKKMSEAHKGPKHHNTSLSWEDVNRVRRDRLSRWFSRQEASELLGVGLSQAEKILSNVSWVDPEYDPSEAPTAPRERHAHGEKVWTCKLTKAQVEEIRNLRTREWVSHIELGKRYGVGKSTIGYILSNDVWEDSNFDPSEVVRYGTTK